MERKVLTYADVMKMNEGKHQCGWDGPGPKVHARNPECNCMCGTAYAEDDTPILSRGGRNGMRCRHADERGLLDREILTPTTQYSTKEKL